MCRSIVLDDSDFTEIGNAIQTTGIAAKRAVTSLFDYDSEVGIVFSDADVTKLNGSFLGLYICV